MYCRQKLGGDFAKFCGLHRIYDFYSSWGLNPNDYPQWVESIHIKPGRNKIKSHSSEQLYRIFPKKELVNKL